MVKIDLGNTYELTSAFLGRENTQMEFISPQSDGTERLIRVEIRYYPDPLLPNVCNLAMGPLTETGKIDDQIRLRHSDRAVVYSTLVLCMLLFLKKYPDLTVGLDGSNDLRAAIYHGIFLHNRHDLDDYLTPFGIDWYVKFLRSREDVERRADGQPYFKPISEPFDYVRSRHDLYRYYAVRLSKSIQNT
jgi:hypothetical protein